MKEVRNLRFLNGSIKEVVGTARRMSHGCGKRSATEVKSRLEQTLFLGGDYDRCSSKKKRRSGPELAGCNKELSPRSDGTKAAEVP